ncbi:MAG: hypothetical protein R3C14_48065 [Caldilineaceae bacterium]
MLCFLTKWRLALVMLFLLWGIGACANPAQAPTVIEPTVIEPTVVEPTVIEPTVIEPTVIEPTVIEPTVIEPTTEVIEVTPVPTAASTAGATVESNVPVVIPSTDTVSAGAQPTLLTASELLDRGFQSRDGAVSGNIKELLVDLTDGRVLFAMLEYGGFLNIGDTNIPVPLRALQWNADGELVLRLNKARLDALPDLGSDWPDLSNANWDDKIVAFWRESGFDPGFDFDNTTSIIMQARDIMNLPVGDIGLGKGEVVDLLLDLENSSVRYIVLSYGPLLGDQLIAVPFSAFNTQVFGNELTLGANLAPETLSAAPNFGPEALQSTPFDPALDAEALAYWQAQGFTVDIQQ